MKTKIPLIPFILLSFLLIPLIAMQFSAEVRWSVADFAIAGTLLLLTGIGIEVILRKSIPTRKKIIWAGLILTGLFLIWLELAVGIFGTPFAGN